MSKKIGEQSLLKYEKLYNWGRTLITSGVIQNEDKFPSENILQKKFGYSRQTVRTALNQLEAEGLIKRVKGSGTYVSYEGNLRNGERPRIGLILSYFSDYLFPRVYDGIDSVMKEAGYDIDVAVTKNRLNDEALYLEGLLNGNVAGFIIEGTRSFFPNPNIRLYEEILPITTICLPSTSLTTSDGLLPIATSRKGKYVFTYLFPTLPNGCITMKLWTRKKLSDLLKFTP